MVQNAIEYFTVRLTYFVL